MLNPTALLSSEIPDFKTFDISVLNSNRNSLLIIFRMLAFIVPALTPK